jgi:hypothetical protein
MTNEENIIKEGILQENKTQDKVVMRENRQFIVEPSVDVSSKEDVVEALRSANVNLEEHDRLVNRAREEFVLKITNLENKLAKFN